MCASRLIIALSMVALLGCKTTQTTQAVTQASYSEDLRVLRPELEEVTNTASETHSEPTVIPTGHIKIELDSISKMISRRNAKPRTEQGFTIQIYNGSSREDATKTLGRFRVKFPEITAKMTYYQPDFRVKAGKFTDRVIAYETYEMVRTNFPEALLIPEKIKINYD